MATKPRTVRIEHATIGGPKGTFFVYYTDRKPGQRYHAAGFDGTMRTREQVAEGVRNNPKLILIDN